jgi:hypothetical protein
MKQQLALLPKAQKVLNDLGENIKLAIADLMSEQVAPISCLAKKS